MFNLSYTYIFFPRLSCLIWIMESQTIMFTEIFCDWHWKWTKMRGKVRGMCPLCSQWQYCVLLDYFWLFEWQSIWQSAVWCHQSGFLVLSFNCLLTTALKKKRIIKGKKRKETSFMHKFDFLSGCRPGRHRQKAEHMEQGRCLRSHINPNSSVL